MGAALGEKNFTEEHDFRGVRVAQPVKCPSLDFSSGHELTVCEFEHHVRLCADREEPAWDPFSPPPSAPPLLMHSLFLKINKYTLKKKKRT